jgi:electron transfer flavoprotein alpha subunit
MPRIFIYVEHRGGVVDDIAAELAAAAHAIDPAQNPTAIAAGWGPELDSVCESLRESFTEIWKIAAQDLAYPNAELVRQALTAVLPAGAIVLAPHSHFGVDLSPGLSVKIDAAFVSDVVAVEGVDGAFLKLVRQEFGGQVSTHVRCSLSSGAVLNIRSGAFKPLAVGACAGLVVEKTPGALSARRRYLQTIVAESADIDIAAQPVLVSVGRGIQDKDNVAIAQELADALGGAVSCSRPVVDAKWMEKSRQVGSSGKTVKPKVYLACGISGSFQHLAGIKGNPFLVAINKNPNAPIFRVADVGIVDDLLEFLPVLTEKVLEEKGAVR